MNALQTGLVIALALAGAACSRVPTTSPATTSPASTSSALDAIGTEASLIERMQRAPLTVRHGGTRRLEFSYQTAGIDHTLVYQERVTADGKGHFALDPVTVEAPPMNVNQREIFDLLQKQREGFFFRYRDFGVRQRELFEANYSVQVLSMPLTIANRECTQVDVRRIGPEARSTYRAAVDNQTGLVLRWTETTLEGRLLARSEFIDFTVDPVLDGVLWFESPLQAVETLQPGHEDASALGFRPHQLQILPAGYQLLHSERIVDHGTTWLRRVYGDGLENMFVLERGPDPAPTSTTPSSGAGSGAMRAVLNDPGLNDAGRGEIVVRVCQAGAWTLAEVVRGTEQLFVVGKVAEDDVIECLQSAF